MQVNLLEPYIESFYFAPNDIILIDGLEFSFGPDELCAYGATMTYEASTPLEAFKKQVQKGISKFRYNEQDETYDNKIKILDYVKKKERKILEDSVGRGHASIPDLPPLVFVLKNVPRAFTLQICAYQFINPLQESGRRVGARGFTLPRNIPERWKIKIQNKLGELNYLREKLFEKVYDLVRDRLKNSYIRNYDEKTREEALEEKSLTRSTEVCRGLFPLYQASNIIVASSLEGFIQFFRDSQHPDIPSTQKEITQIMLEKIKVAMPLLAEQALRVDPLKYYPAPQFYKKNSFIKKVIEKYNYPKKPVLIKVYDFIKIDDMKEAIKNRDENYLTNLKFWDGFTFLKYEAHYTQHQDIRHRTIPLSTESYYDAAERRDYDIPNEIKQIGFENEWKQAIEELFDMYSDMVNDNIPRSDAIGIVPQSMKVYYIHSLNPWNITNKYFSERLCVPKAQPEIRLSALEEAKIIRENNSILGYFAEPKCVILGYCPEKFPCEYLDKWLEKQVKEQERILREEL